MKTGKILTIMIMPYIRCILLSAILFFHTINNAIGQETSELQAPLRYPDSLVTNFSFGLELTPTVLPSGNLLTNISLLGKGFYLSKLLGRTNDGALIYSRPQFLNHLSATIDQTKVVYLESDEPKLIASNKKNKHWQYYKANESKDNLTLTNPIDIKIDGKPLTGDFTIFRQKGKNYALKIRAIKGNYWPGNQHPWGVPPNPDIGFNKGYDADGIWLGQKTIVQVSYTEQLNDWNFSAWKTVFEDDKPFVINEYSSAIKLTVSDFLQNGQKQVLISYDVDKQTAYDIRISDKGMVFKLIRLPKGIPSTTKESYFSMPTTLTKAIDKSNGFLLGGNPGTLTEFYSKNGVWNSRPVMVKGGDLHVQTLAVPNFIDWDNNGSADIIAGDASGFLWFIKNLGSTDLPVWDIPQKMLANGKLIHHQAGYSGSIQGPNEKRWGYLQPLVCDWDNDGLLDVVCNDITGKYLFYKNTGTKGAPVLAKAVPIMYLKKQYKAACRSKPALLPKKYLSDHSPKSLPSFVAINGEGNLCVYKRDSSAPNNIFNEQVLMSNNKEPVRIVGFAGHEGRATLGVCDYNSDGIWDVVFGQGVHMSQSKVAPGAKPYATAYIMVNKGTNEEPLFDIPKPICQENGKPINLDRHGAWIYPLLNDKDNLVDLFIGGEDGRFYHFKKVTLCNQ
ncbi:hypothetical protein ABDJ41_20145 [Pedobacter sp. ASV1-7]|uniref:hypothetical protein n=1 Tax=Pedobacter sp. ASV1-7 TaxID=3145237 RepID=UPI0032E929C8